MENLRIMRLLFRANETATKRSRMTDTFYKSEALFGPCEIAFLRHAKSMNVYCRIVRYTTQKTTFVANDSVASVCCERCPQRNFGFSRQEEDVKALEAQDRQD